MTNFFQSRFNLKENTAFNTLEELMTLPQILFYKKFPIIPACMKFHKFSIQRKQNDARVNLIAEYNEGITKMKIGYLNEAVNGLDEVSPEENTNNYLIPTKKWYTKELSGRIKSVMIPAEYVEELKKISIIEGTPVRKVVAQLVNEYLKNRGGAPQVW